MGMFNDGLPEMNYLARCNTAGAISLNKPTVSAWIIHLARALQSNVPCLTDILVALLIFHFCWTHCVQISVSWPGVQVNSYWRMWLNSGVSGNISVNQQTRAICLLRQTLITNAYPHALPGNYQSDSIHFNNFWIPSAPHSDLGDLWYLYPCDKPRCDAICLHMRDIPIMHKHTE